MGTTSKCGTESGSHAQLFDKPYYIILNSAVGGSNWPGRATQRTKFPTYHYVDFVRVAQPSQSSPWCLDGVHSENACCPHLAVSVAEGIVKSGLAVTIAAEVCCWLEELHR